MDPGIDADAGAGGLLGWGSFGLTVVAVAMMVWLLAGAMRERREVEELRRSLEGSVLRAESLLGALRWPRKKRHGRFRGRSSR